LLLCEIDLQYKVEAMVAMLEWRMLFVLAFVPLDGAGK
jgi:hypothetical protein